MGVCLLTRSVNEHKGRKAAINKESLSDHIKQLRRAYLLSLLLFSTNTQCCYPFHVQLADTVECCGGSAELLQILNRLGITASLETLKRHIHNVSEIRKQTGIDGLLVDKAFTVASVDNRFPFQLCCSLFRLSTSQLACNKCPVSTT